MDYSIRTATGRMEIALSGRLTFSDNGRFSEIVEKMEAVRVPEYVVDLGRLEFIDSAGLGMLIIANETAQDAKGRLRLNNAGGQVAQMLKLSQFESLM